MKINKLKCIRAVSGFTVGEIYDIVDISSDPVTIRAFDNNLALRSFETIEGNFDFKNWFVGVTIL